MIQNPELLKLVKYKLGIFDPNQELPEEELAKVKDLVIRDRSLSGKPLNIDLSEIGCLTELEELDLSMFQIGAKEAETISSFAKLKRLSLRDSMIDAPINTQVLDSLLVERGEIREEGMLPEAKSVSLVSMENIDLNKIKGVEQFLSSLTIRGGNISNINRLENAAALTSLTIEATEVDKETINRLTEKNIFVNYNEDKGTLYNSKTY